MSWNNGRERKLFEKRQAILAEQYRSVGMTEEQIKKMYEFDLAVFRSERIYYTHTQALEICFDNDDEDVCDVSNYLLEYHQTSNFRDYSNRYWWVDELERLYSVVKKLSDEEKEIITLYVFEGYTQKEIANFLHYPKSTLNDRMTRIKKKILSAQGGKKDE